MLNSRNYTRDPEILQIGETIESEFENVPGLKTYYHQTKGAQTHMPDGAAIKFIGGVFSTSNEEIKAFLDKIADKPGTQIYTKVETARRNVQELADLAEEAKENAGNAQVNKGHVKATADTLKQTEQSLKSIVKPETADEQKQVRSQLAAKTSGGQA